MSLKTEPDTGRSRAGNTRHDYQLCNAADIHVRFVVATVFVVVEVGAGVVSVQIFVSLLEAKQTRLSSIHAHATRAMVTMLTRQRIYTYFLLLPYLSLSLSLLS